MRLRPVRGAAACEGEAWMARLAFCLFVLYVFPAALLSADPGRDGKRVALVVGNATYHNVPSLDNSGNDAGLMADTLRGLGFALVGGGAQLDLDKRGLDQAVHRFGQEAEGADVALFYYAGHGIQVKGENYLVPIEANAKRESDVDFQMLNVALVLSQLENARSELNIVILDACRNNPFGARGLRTVGRGLAPMDAGVDTLISFATAPGAIAQDGTGRHSPYTEALARTIRQPGLDVLQVFNDVGLAVRRATGGSQVPWLSSSPIDRSFHFVRAPAVPMAPEPADPCAAAAAHWKQAERIGRKAFEEHRARFPDCPSAALAQERIDELKRADEARKRVEADEKKRAEETKKRLAEEVDKVKQSKSFKRKRVGTAAVCFTQNGREYCQ
jgi:uncharacterized caspase-like protein